MYPNKISEFSENILIDLNWLLIVISMKKNSIIKNDIEKLNYLIALDFSMKGLC